MSNNFTLRRLSTQGDAKKVDLYRIRHADLVIVDGFNARMKTPELRAHIDAMKSFLLTGGSMPPIEVWVNPETGATEVVEGHCRTTAYGELIAANASDVNGEKISEWIDVQAFKGTPAQRKARIVTSNNQLPLSSLELGAVYKSMRDEHGMKPAEIAAEVCKSRAHVDQMLLLIDAPAEVHEAINSGEIAPTEAVKLVREHGQDSGSELESRKEAAGGKKVTAKVAPRKPKQDTNALIQAVRGLVSTIEEGVKERILLGGIEYVEVRADLFAEIIEAAAGLTDEDAGMVSSEEQLSLLEEA